MAGGRHGGGLRGTEASRHVSAAGRALGLLLSRALSSRLPVSIIGQGLPESSVVFLEEVVDCEILLNERQTTSQGVSSVLRR